MSFQLQPLVPGLNQGCVDVTLLPESRSLWGSFATLELRSCQKKLMVIDSSCRNLDRIEGFGLRECSHWGFLLAKQ